MHGPCLRVFRGHAEMDQPPLRSQILLECQQPCPTVCTDEVVVLHPHCNLRIGQPGNCDLAGQNDLLSKLKRFFSAKSVAGLLRSIAFGQSMEM